MVNWKKLEGEYTPKVGDVVKEVIYREVKEIHTPCQYYAPEIRRERFISAPSISAPTRKVWIIKGPDDLELTPYRPKGIPAHSIEMTEEGWQNYRKTRDDYFSWERWIWDRLNDKGEEK